MGFIPAEEDGVVEVRDNAGQFSKVKRADFTEESNLQNSMMPPELADALTVGDSTPLIEYFVSLKAKGGWDRDLIRCRWIQEQHRLFSR
jgi:hypothetical protein